MRMLLSVGTLLGLAACPLEFPEVYESGSNGQPDAAVADVVTDRSSADLPRDASVADNAPVDSAIADSAINDSTVADAASLDAGAGDSASSDQAAADTASSDSASAG